MSRIMVMTAVIASALTAFFSMLMFKCCFGEPALATVDVAGITSEFIKEEATKNHSSQEKKEAIAHFSHSLESALQTLSHDKKIVLLPKEAVFSGSPDYTKELIETMRVRRTS